MEIHVYLHECNESKSLQLRRVEEMLASLINNNQGGQIMGKLEDLQAAIQAVKADIVAEKSEVQTKLVALAAEVQGLKDSLAGGSAVTAAQLDALIVDVNAIGTEVKGISEPHA